MKRIFLLLAMLLMGVLTFAEEIITVSTNSEEISQNLDLRVVAKLFAEASTTEQFENLLNNSDSAFSNLDLNGDNQIDYLRVIETGSDKSRLIVIQAVLAKDIYQDVASIYVEKDNQEQVSVQIIGDEYIYGINYIIEPVYIYRPVIYNWFWSPRWYCWHSPYYWGYYPSWWYYRPCYAYHWYYDRCYRFHQYHRHYCSFRHGHYPHHNYHAVHNSVSRRDYAVSHPDNSVNSRRTAVKNAGEFRRTSASQRNGGVRQSNFNSTLSRTFNSRNTAAQRSGNSQRGQSTTMSQRSSDNDQRTISTSVSTQHSTNQSGISRTSQTRTSNNTNKSTVSAQQRTNNGQVRSSSSSSYRSSGSYGSSLSRSSSTSSSRSTGNYSGSSRSNGCGGSDSYSGGSVSRSSGSSVSKSSGGCCSSRHK